MDEKKLLNEITYYSKLVNHYQTLNAKQDYKSIPRTVKNNYYPLNKVPNMKDKNKYVYIKKSNFSESMTSLITSVPQNQNLDAIAIKPSTKVHINPNFKQSVHINPHFKPNLTKPSNMVHVNPKHFPRQVIQMNSIKESETDLIKNEETKLLNVPTSTSTNLVNTPTKLVKCHKIVSKRKIINASRTSAICSKYKIVRKLSSPKTSNIIINKKQQPSKYKLDRRVATRKRLSSSSFKSKYVYIKKNCTSLIRINGKLFKKIDNNSNLKPQTKQWLQKVDSKNDSKPKLKLISIAGQMYHMNTNRRTLKIITKSNGKQEELSEKENFLKFDRQRKRILILQARQKSIGTLMNKMQKNNIPCLLFRKFGRCKGQEKGTCKKVHNANQISLCQKFLQGACVNNNCLLSHKVSAEKMPTCRFYLEGNCIREDCPYLHVKINRNAQVCKDFLEGFCRDADKCTKRHQYLCADFEKNGKCTKPKCRFPHVGGASGRTCDKQNSAGSLKTVSSKRALVSIVNSNHVLNEEPESSARYYTESKDLDYLVSIPNSNNAVDSDLRERPKLGRLPSFIPFFSP